MSVRRQSRALLALACVIIQVASTTTAMVATTTTAMVATTAATTELVTAATTESAMTETTDAAIDEPATFGCPAQCDCITYEEMSCNISGTEVTVSYKSGEYAYITCDSPDPDAAFWRRLPALGRTLRRAAALGVRDCPLPDASYADVASALGMSARALADLTLRGAPDAARLARSHLAGLSALHKLSLADSPAFSVRADLLADTPALAELRAQGARAVLPLDPAPALRTLELAGADLRRVGADAFGGQAGLRRLLLWGANVSVLDDAALHGLRRLETLDLSSNALRELPPGLFRDARRLRELSLAGNAVRALPPGLLTGLTALREVRLHDNGAPLELAPESFAGLERLAVLQLSRSGIGALPASALRGCASLRELWLAGNALESLPALAGLAALERLDVSDNYLARLSPGQFSSLVALRTLVLDGNNITELPDGALDGLRSLAELSAARAGLARLRVGALAGASGLRALRLSHNALGVAAAAAVARLVRLERLELAHNALESVPEPLRLALLQLAHVDLSHNRIGDLQFADVNFLAGNVTVDLRHNNISRLDLADAAVLRVARADSDPGAAGGATLLLEGNPLRCDCSMYLWRGADGGAGGGAAGVRAQAGRAECAAPPALAGRRVAGVAPGELQCAVEGAGCAGGCACAWWPASRTLRLRCASWPELPATPRGTRLALRLAGSGLRALPLASVPPPELEEVDLGDNPLSELDERTARSLLAHNRSVDLSGARLPCACADAALLDTLAAAAGRLRGYTRLRCADGGLVREAARRRCVPRGAVVGAAAAAVLLVAALAAAWALRRGSGPRAWLAARGVRCLAAADADEAKTETQYDVFVSFAHEDEALVAGELAPRLEARGLRLCLHFRDWAVGEPIPEQIAQSVRTSRRTLVVASAAWARSAWAQQEWAAARAGGGAAVVVVGEWAPDAGMARYLRRHTYVKWGDPWFWDKLMAALPAPRAPRAPHAPRAPLPARLGFSDRLWGARGARGARLAHNLSLGGAKDLSGDK